VDDALGESVGIERITAEYGEALFDELDNMILREGLVDVFYEMAFERLISRGHTFQVVDTTSYFSWELDTVEDFNHVNDVLAESPDLDF
jgi:choline kinase